MPNLNVRTGRCVRYALPYRNSANAILMLSTYRKAKHELVSLGVRNSSSLQQTLSERTYLNNVQLVAL